MNKPVYLIFFTLTLFTTILLKAQCPDPGTCNTDCTIGNIEIWNDQTCQCEDSIVFIGQFPAQFNLGSLNGSNGFIINGIDNGDNSGRSVSNAGDINGDGIDDLIIGARGADPNESDSGETYVVYGSNSFSAASLNLSALNGNNGFVINGINSFNFSGLSVSNAGDINGDGIDDLIIGALSVDPYGNYVAGESYVVYGSNSFSAASLNLSALNGSNGFVINGIDADGSGYSLSNAGDINGDGIDDLIIGVWKADPNGNSNAGESYVVYGSNSFSAASLNLNTLNGSNGFVINGIDAIDASGFSVSNAGDINDDGIDDLIIGAVSADPNGNGSSGESYVVYGSTNFSAASLNLNDLNGNNGFVINGIDAIDASGFSVSNAGDINDDGIDDLIIGAVSADPNGNGSSGESYVVYGSNSFSAASLNLSTLNGSNGFVVNGIDADDLSGNSVSNAGDINGDGIDDIIIGAYFGDPNGNSNAGESYVVYGSNSFSAASLNLSALNGSNGFVINGIDNGDFSGNSVSNAGDINGDGIDDLIIGAWGADPNGSDSGESYVVFGRGKIQGCTDSLANNYNPNANCDDGSCDFTTSIQEVNEININIHPNPTNGLINIETDFQFNKVEVFNLDGKKVFTSNKMDKQIDISNLNAGIYMISIANKKSQFSKMVLLIE